MKTYNLPKRPLNALYEEELRAFLEAHHLLEPLQRGELKCVVCGDVLTEENIGAFIRKGEGFQIVCRKPSCMMIALTQEDQSQ